MKYSAFPPIKILVYNTTIQNVAQIKCVMEDNFLCPLGGKFALDCFVFLQQMCRAVNSA